MAQETQPFALRLTQSFLSARNSVREEMMLPAAQNTKRTDRHKIGEVGVHARGGERIAHHHHE